LVSRRSSFHVTAVPEFPSAPCGCFHAALKLSNNLLNVANCPTNVHETIETLLCSCCARSFSIDSFLRQHATGAGSHWSITRCVILRRETDTLHRRRPYYSSESATRTFECLSHADKHRRLPGSPAWCCNISCLNARRDLSATANPTHQNDAAVPRCKSTATTTRRRASTTISPSANDCGKPDPTPAKGRNGCGAEPGFHNHHSSTDEHAGSFAKLCAGPRNLTCGSCSHRLCSGVTQLRRCTCACPRAV
jgi:hypothetical protein